MILFKKAVRSMWDNKKAYLACIVLIMIGVFINNVTGIAADVFSVARDKYYKDYRLADVFAKVRAMPTSALTDLERVDGINEASGRYVYDARVLLPNNDKMITLRITSLDTTYNGMPVNGVMITSGNLPSASDIMVGAAFLETHGLKIGDTISVVIERKIYDLTICAEIESPEYVYAVKNNLEILPDAEAFGFSFMSQDGLWAIAGQYGVYNDICMLLDDNVSYESVKSSLEDVLQKYGLLSMYQRKDHPSVSMVDMELDSISSMSSVMPLVFMMMAVVVLYLMLKRIIEQERTQIGVLKAFGYSNNAILLHYMVYGTVTGAIGGLLGCVYGVVVSGPYISIFMEFFKLPVENVAAPASLLLRGFGIAVATGVFGGYFGARRSLKLNPADAMRAEAPKAIKSDILKTLPFLQLFLSSGGNMAVRSISRNKMRSGVIILGVVFSFGLLGFMGSYNVMIDFMMINQFSKVQKYDVKFIFKNPVEYNTAEEAVAKLEGVTLAEGILEIPIEIKNKNLKTGLSLIGLESGSALYAIYDNVEKNIFPPPTDGIIINDGVSKKIKANKGDIVYLSSTMFDEDIKVVITDVVQQNLGLSCYMEINAMSRLFDIQKTATSVIVKAEDTSLLTDLMNEADNIAVIEDKASTLKNYSQFLAPYSGIIYIMWVFSVIVAFAIIYNTSTISLSERKREYATLRVMGMQVKEVGAIMGFEYWVLCFIGMLLGVPFTILLKEALATFLVMDAFTFPTFTPISAYLQAAAGCMTAVFLSNRSALRQIKKFDMVEVLKERE